MQIEMLLPRQSMLALEELQKLFPAAGAMAEPFHESVVDAVVDFSQRISHDPEARGRPELLALAYWMRKSEMIRLANQFRALQLENRQLVPRGLVFHLPPRNVGTMFVYSWLLAALTGNRSIIRLSPTRSDSTHILVRLLRETLAEADEPASSAAIIVSYGHDLEPTEMLSALCDVRVIWGGDQTVEIIRRSPLAPHAKEITFSDRYSMSAIRTDAYLGLSEEERDQLAGRFFNDSFWFDQLACSSPRLVAWCGSGNEARAASADFFTRVAGCVDRRRYVLPVAATMQKFVFACSAIITSAVEQCQRYKGLTVLTLGSLAGFPRTHPGGGLFFEVQLESLSELACFLGRQDQTLTWFGFIPEELRSLVRCLNGRALDRVVPIGQALIFHRFWDGYDLLQDFCRCVYVDCSTSPVGSSRMGTCQVGVSAAY